MTYETDAIVIPRPLFDVAVWCVICGRWITLERHEHGDIAIHDAIPHPEEEPGAPGRGREAVEEGAMIPDDDAYSIQATEEWP